MTNPTTDHTAAPHYRSTTMSTTHLAGQHYRPLITGQAAPMVGTDTHLRQVAMLVGAYTDQCEQCQSDMLDAVALSGELMAVLHSVFRIVTEGILVPCDSADGQAVVQAQWDLPFAFRRAGAAKEAAAVSAWLTRPRNGWA